MHSGVDLGHNGAWATLITRFPEENHRYKLWTNHNYQMSRRKPLLLAMAKPSPSPGGAATSISLPARSSWSNHSAASKFSLCRACSKNVMNSSQLACPIPLLQTHNSNKNYVLFHRRSDNSTLIWITTRYIKISERIPVNAFKKFEGPKKIICSRLCSKKNTLWGHKKLRSYSPCDIS